MNDVVAVIEAPAEDITLDLDSEELLLTTIAVNFRCSKPQYTIIYRLPSIVYHLLLSTIYRLPSNYHLSII